MALATIDDTAYGKLLARALPRVIKTAAENERIIAEIERLDARGGLTPEEREPRLDRGQLPSYNVICDTLFLLTTYKPQPLPGKREGFEKSSKPADVRDVRGLAHTRSRRAPGRRTEPPYPL